MTVLLPEKTLEHWASQYILYLFRSKANVWWPSFGVDIDIQGLPLRPGKLLSLEMKTATISGQGYIIIIKRKQLSAYARMPRAAQPFYVFPLPDWNWAAH